MTKDELTAIGLTDEQVTAVLNLYKPAADAVSKLDAANEELKRAQATIVERNQQLDGLKTANAESKTLKQQIEQLQAQNKDAEDRYKAELLASKKSFAVRQALLEAEQKPQNVKIVMDQLDLDKVSLDEAGNLTGLYEQQARLLKEAPYLFKTEQSQPKAQNGFAVHGAGAQPEQPAQPNAKPGVATAEFGRKLAAVTLQSQGLKLQENP